MKKIKYLALLLVALLLPIMVFADEEEAGDDKQAIVYFFRGQGCSHCAEAEEWFKSIEEEHGDKFKIVDYETWYNEENAELMKKVAAARGEEEQASGVHYIIIGDKEWFGFADEYKDSIIEQIDKVYGQEVSERYDALKYAGSSKASKKDEKKVGKDIVALIIILAACGGIGFGIYKARKSTN